MEWKAVAICHPLVIQKKGGGRGLKGVQGLSTTASTWPCWKSRNRSWRRFFWDKDFIQCRGGGRVNKPQQTPLNQFYKEPGSEKMPRLINNPLTAPGKLQERSPWGLRFTTDTNISGENQQGIKWPEAHREWHSWVPAFFKKKQLLQSSGGKSTNMVAWRICYRLLSISVSESWARPQQWFGCGGLSWIPAQTSPGTPPTTPGSSPMEMQSSDAGWVAKAGESAYPEHLICTQVQEELD